MLNLIYFQFHHQTENLPFHFQVVPPTSSSYQQLRTHGYGCMILSHYMIMLESFTITWFVQRFVFLYHLVVERGITSLDVGYPFTFSSMCLHESYSICQF